MDFNRGCLGRTAGGERQHARGKQRRHQPWSSRPRKPQCRRLRLWPRPYPTLRLKLKLKPPPRLNRCPRRLRLLSHEVTTGDEGAAITAQLLLDGEHRTAVGRGSGPIDAFVHALKEGVGMVVDIVDYSEHAVSSGSDATAVAYVESLSPDGTIKWGVGLHPSILTASLQAVVSAANRQAAGAG